MRQDPTCRRKTPVQREKMAGSGRTMRKRKNNEETHAAKLEMKERKKSLNCNLGVKCNVHVDLGHINFIS